MVNTFLTDADFTTSAASLDRQRLGKQRVEAYQILTLIQDLRRLAYLFGYTPNQFPDLRSFIKHLVGVYRNSGYRVYVCRRMLICCSIEGPSAPGREIKLGFVYHPAVRMWYGYEDALKAYINAHIDEWVTRGYQNTMIRYTIPEKFDRPPWTDNASFHQNHRAALLNKEYQRREAPWYQQQPLFLTAGPFDDYYWPVD